MTDPANPASRSTAQNLIDLSNLVRGLESVGELVRSLRGQRTQQEFAKLIGPVIGSSRTYLAQIERGHTEPSLKMLRRLLDLVESGEI